jgi:hypothetical protein
MAYETLRPRSKAWYMTKGYIWTFSLFVPVFLLALIFQGRGIFKSGRGKE